MSLTLYPERGNKRGEAPTRPQHTPRDANVSTDNKNRFAVRNSMSLARYLRVSLARQAISWKPLLLFFSCPTTMLEQMGWLRHLTTPKAHLQLISVCLIGWPTTIQPNPWISIITVITKLFVLQDGRKLLVWLSSSTFYILAVQCHVKVVGGGG